MLLLTPFSMLANVKIVNGIMKDLDKWFERLVEDPVKKTTCVCVCRLHFHSKKQTCDRNLKRDHTRI